MSLETPYELHDGVSFMWKELYLVVNWVVRKEFLDYDIKSFWEVDYWNPILWNSIITLFMMWWTRVMVVIDLRGWKLSMWTASIHKSLTIWEVVEVTKQECLDAQRRIQWGIN